MKRAVRGIDRDTHVRDFAERAKNVVTREHLQKVLVNTSKQIKFLFKKRVCRRFSQVTIGCGNLDAMVHEATR